MNEGKYNKIRGILKNKTVGIAGLGGLGSNAAISLARIGIGKLILVDYDLVEKSNLNRQYYFKNQIGKYKVDALRENIKLVNPECIVETKNIQLQKGSMHQPFKEADVIIEALDKAQIKTNFIEEIMNIYSQKPLVAASGVSGYGNSDRISTEHLGNLYLVYDEQAKSSDEDILTGPRVALIANWQANIVLEILLGEDK